MKKNWEVFVICLFVLAIMVLSACKPTVVVIDENGIYGFWNGLWDGLTAFIAVGGNLLFGFEPYRTTIYHSINNGDWYDIGFVLGFVIFVTATVSLIDLSDKEESDKEEAEEEKKE